MIKKYYEHLQFIAISYEKHLFQSIKKCQPWGIHSM
jgi:hypothetical protein